MLGTLLFVSSLVDAQDLKSVLLIVADDLGYNEHNFMNNGSKALITPNLDRLAAEGVVLQNYYVQPICSPTRSALMTGRYPIRLGTQANVIYWDTPWAISKQELFISEHLEGTHDTALFGKWHLGMYRNASAPWGRGFHKTEGYLQGCGSAWTHESSCCQAQTASRDQDYICPKGKDQKDYRGYDWFTDGTVNLEANGTNSAPLIRDAAVEFIHNYSRQRILPAGTMQRPFFLYLPFQNIHAPYTCEQIYIDEYANHSHFTDEEKVMYGYLSEMDDAVGHIVEALKDHDLWENTLVIYTSDNGAPNAPQVRNRNFPFRGFKTQIWEGGTRVPAFVSGGVVPIAVRGSKSRKLFHVTDWFPTVASVTGVPIPNDRLYDRPLDGHNIWSALTSEAPSPRDEILYNVNPLCTSGQAGAPKAGLRVKNWKLLAYCFSVKGIDGASKTGPFMPDTPKSRQWPFSGAYALFDLANDPTETQDLSSRYPAVASKMLARLTQLAEEMVEPMQWNAPYQGAGYACAECPLHPATGPYEPWLPWIE